MITVRRIYAYLLAFAGLAMVAVASANLLQLVIDVAFQSLLAATDTAVRDTVSRSVAVALVGLCVWRVHWAWIERWLGNPDERASTLRRLYVYVVLTASALVLAYALQDALRIALESGLRGQATEVWQRPLAFGVPAAVVWLVHLRIAVRDRRLVGEDGGSATLRRWYVYGVSFVGLGMLVGGAQGVLQGLWMLITTPGVAPDSAALLLASPAATALVGLGFWLGHWTAGSARQADGPATLRSVYLFLVLALAVTGTLFGLSQLLYYAVARWLGVQDPGGVGGNLVQAAAGPASVAIVYGLVWAYQRAALRHQAAAFAEAPRQAGVRRLYGYLVMLVGLAVLASGVAGLLWTLGDLALNAGAIGADEWRGRVALFSTLAIVGLPVWLLHWRATPTHSADIASLARRLYLYLSLIGAMLTLLGSVAAVLYRLLSLALGGASSVHILTDLAHAMALALVSGSIAAYHWLVLRADARRLAPSDDARAEPAPRRVRLEITAQDAAALERALSALRATGVQVSVR